jgi:ABC-type glycerol-3-phosphate transport system permease component
MSAPPVSVDPGEVDLERSPLMSRVVALALTVVTVLVVLVIVFPFLWILISSFKSPDHFLSLNLSDAIPHSPTLSSYRLAINETSLLRWILNSFIVALSTTLLSLLICAPAAFAFARLRFRGRGLASILLVFSYAIPSITLVVPLFVVLVNLGLNDTYIGLIVVHASFTIPFVTWVLTDFYRSIPVDLEAAGYIDGASLLRVLRHVILPLSLPGLLAAGAYAFILSWNDFLFAFVIMNSDAHYTAPVGISAYFAGQNVTQQVWAELMSASVLVTLPSVILFGFFQRYIVSGFLAGAVKG